MVAEHERNGRLPIPAIPKNVFAQHPAFAPSESMFPRLHLQNFCHIRPSIVSIPIHLPVQISPKPRGLLQLKVHARAGVRRAR